MAAVKQAACVGAGVIGGGWVARYLWNGIDVHVYDPDPNSEQRCRDVLANAERALRRLHGHEPARRGRLTFSADLAAAVSDADIIQESAPEDVDTKRAILRDIDGHARSDALIGSSTSGLLPSQLQADMARPERFFVSHPFNPVYLLPLVELCAGEKTAPEAVNKAAEIYRFLGMRALHVRREIDGFIADRLLEALWREALWLVHDGVATVEEVDDAVRFGAGLRWALMGSFQTYRIAGGEQGMRHFMAQFGPALQWPWTKLTEVPELSDEFVDRIAAESDRQADGRSIRTLERERDDGLIAILQGLRQEKLAAGETLADYAATLSGPVPPGADLDAAAPLALRTANVTPAVVDYNGHMTESAYLEQFGRAGTELFHLLGVDQAYIDAGASFFTVETHIQNLCEIRVDEPFRVTTQVLGTDDKRIHVFHRMFHAQSNDLLATAEQMYLHVDTQAGRATAAPAAVQERMERVTRAHAAVEWPEAAGRALRPLRRPPSAAT